MCKPTDGAATRVDTIESVKISVLVFLGHCFVDHMWGGFDQIWSVCELRVAKLHTSHVLSVEFTSLRQAPVGIGLFD